jgi:hypothetical protein
MEHHERLALILLHGPFGGYEKTRIPWLFC